MLGEVPIINAHLETLELAISGLNPHTNLPKGSPDMSVLPVVYTHHKSGGYNVVVIGWMDA